MPPEESWQRLETFGVVRAAEMLPASSGWRPGMLLNILKYTGQPPTTKEFGPKYQSSNKVTKPA